MRPFPVMLCVVQVFSLAQVVPGAFCKPYSNRMMHMISVCFHCWVLCNRGSCPIY